MIIVYNNDNNILYQLIADKTYKYLALEGNAIVELDFLDESEIRELNFKERKIDKSTDVLSFPFLEEIKCFSKENYPLEYDPSIDAVSLGTIVICPTIAQNQASEYGHSFIREKCYLFLHGLLHLLGYDHEADEDKKNMRKVEKSIIDSVTL